MHKKALTIAIAGALAAPVAAQAVDFKISGHVNRALVIVDSDKTNSSKAGVKNNGSSTTRIRWEGSSEMMDGTSVGFKISYQEGAVAKADSKVTEQKVDEKTTGLTLRHANVYYAGEFGKMTIGQGSEAGDGSAYRGNVGTFGIGIGQEMGTDLGFSLKGYFNSLDAGGRVNMIRYDTPALGPVGAAVSVGNNDRISLAATLSTEFSGSSFKAMVASLREDGVEGKAQETVGASFGVSMANGLGISGAWARKDNHGITAANMHTPIDPSYFQAGIAYSFGDTKVAASWWNTEDFVTEGSSGSAIGVGVNHDMPKVGAQVYAAVQGYSVEDDDRIVDGEPLDKDETVFVVGTRVKF